MNDKSIERLSKENSSMQTKKLADELKLSVKNEQKEKIPEKNEKIETRNQSNAQIKQNEVIEKPKFSRTDQIEEMNRNSADNSIKNEKNQFYKENTLKRKIPENFDTTAKPTPKEKKNFIAKKSNTNEDKTVTIGTKASTSTLIPSTLKSTSTVQKKKASKKSGSQSSFTSTMKSIFSTLTGSKKPVKKRPIRKSIHFDDKRKIFYYADFKGPEMSLSDLKAYKGRVSQLVKHYEKLEHKK